MSALATTLAGIPNIRRRANTTAAVIPHNRQNGVRDKATSSSTETSLAETSGILSQTIKIVVFGAACSGKTSAIKQFIGNGQEFSEQYDPTDRKSNYFRTILSFDTNTQKITHWALKIVDVPVTDVPVASVLSWSNFLEYDVGHAAAYILMFDVNAQFHSFDFIRSMREQLINHQNTCDGLMFVVGNKVDLPYSLNRSDVVHTVQKQWKCAYLECSAKKNYHIVGLFQTIIESVQTKLQSAAKANSSDGFRRTFKTPKCIIQ